MRMAGEDVQRRRSNEPDRNWIDPAERRAWFQSETTNARWPIAAG
jgi:hypothetical protein